MVTRHTVAISRVLHGWTGSLTIVPDTGPTVVVTPRSGDSVASLLARAAALLWSRTGVRYRARPDTTGKVRLEAGDDFEVTAITGTVATWTQLSAGTSSGGVLLGDDVAEGVHVPDHGGACTPDMGTTTAPTVGSGATAAGPRPVAGGSVRLECQDDGAAPGIEADTGVFDYWGTDGKVWSRFTASGWVRTRPGKRGTGPCTLTPDGGPSVMQGVP